MNEYSGSYIYERNLRNLGIKDGLEQAYGGLKRQEKQAKKSIAVRALAPVLGAYALLKFGNIESDAATAGVISAGVAAGAVGGMRSFVDAQVLKAQAYIAAREGAQICDETGIQRDSWIAQELENTRFFYPQ